jgi:hypothetical protein
MIQVGVRERRLEHPAFGLPERTISLAAGSSMVASGPIENFVSFGAAAPGSKTDLCMKT